MHLAPPRCHTRLAAKRAAPGTWTPARAQAPAPRAWRASAGQTVTPIAESKAIRVARHGDSGINHIAFSGCRVPGDRGAGIRFEKGWLRLRRCRFADNPLGLLSGHVAGVEPPTDESVFSNAPVNPDPLPRRLYRDTLSRYSLQRSRLLRRHGRHLFKGRLRESVITGNRLDDGPLGEASNEIDLPNRGIARVEGNTLAPSLRSHNPVLLAYGAENRAWDRNSLALRGKPFITQPGPSGVCARVWADGLSAVCQRRTPAPNTNLGSPLIDPVMKLMHHNISN